MDCVWRRRTQCRYCIRTYDHEGELDTLFGIFAASTTSSHVFDAQLIELWKLVTGSVR